MSEQPNVPMVSSSSESFFQVWIRALTRPSEQTYAALASGPNVKAGTAYLWIFIGYLVQFFLASLVQGVAVRRLMDQFGNGGLTEFTSGIGGRLVVMVCGAPIAAVIGTIFFAIGVFIVQWLAKLFGGRGSADQLAYVLAAILTPLLLISGVVSLLSAIPYVGFCFNLIWALVTLYVIVLEVMAVKGVNQFGWGAAIGSLFIPGLVVAFICGCLAVASTAVLGTAVRDIFQQMQQGIQ